MGRLVKVGRDNLLTNFFCFAPLLGTKLASICFASNDAATATGAATRVFRKSNSVMLPFPSHIGVAVQPRQNPNVRPAGGYSPAKRH
jgi:hypothetical protein